MNSYQLSIVTPNGKVFEGFVESLTAPGAAGFLGVLAGHAPMAVCLTSGPLTVKEEDQKRYYAISSGILEVGSGRGQNKVIILSDYAVEKNSFEEAKLHTTQLSIN